MTAFQLTSPLWREGAFWGFQATVPQVRIGLLSMTNSALSCFIHKKLMCKSSSVKKCFLPVNRDRPKLTKKKSKRKNGGTLKQLEPVFFFFFKKEQKSRYKSNFQCFSLRRQVCFLICRAMFLRSAFQFGFLVTVETLSFLPLEVYFGILFTLWKTQIC